MPITSHEPEHQGTDFNKLLKRCFWLCLFVAASLFAAVYLAPSYVTYLKLNVTRYDNQVKLVTLERSVQYLGTISDVQSHASQQSMASLMGEEYQLDPQMLQPIKKIPQATLPGNMNYIELLATSSTTRQSVIAAAGVLLVFAFVFLQDSSAIRLRATVTTIGNGFRWVTRRYSRHEKTEEEEIDDDTEVDLVA